MHTVTSKDGTTIAYERTGGGPALVIVGGALNDRGAAAPLAALLSPRFTVIAYDRRGRGDSTDTAPYAVEREIEDLAALIDATGGCAYAVGHSSGAALVLESAARGLLPASLGKDQECLAGIPQAEMALPSLDPPPVARLQRAGEDLGGDFCQVFDRPGPDRGG